MTQNELATIFGLKGVTIGAYEKGTVKPSLDVVDALVQYFNVRIDMFLYEKIDEFGDGALPSENEIDDEEKYLTKHLQLLREHELLHIQSTELREELSDCHRKIADRDDLIVKLQQKSI